MWHETLQALPDLAVLYIHALNPHGFSFWRRVTQEGVDLNRNFHDFAHHAMTTPEAKAQLLRFPRARNRKL